MIVSDSDYDPNDGNQGEGFWNSESGNMASSSHWVCNYETLAKAFGVSGSPTFLISKMSRFNKMISNVCVSSISLG